MSPSTPENALTELLALFQRAFKRGLRPHVRLLMARDPAMLERPWRPVCGRFDIARPGDPAPSESRPKGDVRLIEQDIHPSIFMARFSEAVQGKPLVIGDVEIPEHGMHSGWAVYRCADDWREWGSAWPCWAAWPMNQIPNRPHIGEPIEADGPFSAFADLDQLVQRVTAIGERDRRSIRYRSFYAVIWDYRGRIDRFFVNGTTLSVDVSPKNNSSLKLLVVAEALGEEPTSRVEQAPSTLELRMAHSIARAKAALRLDDEVLADAEAELQPSLAVGTTEPAPTEAMPAVVPTADDRVAFLRDPSCARSWLAISPS